MICVTCKHKDEKHYPWCEAAQRVEQELTVRDREDLINQFIQNLYLNSERTFTPMYPWIFVRILPKEQMYKGVVIAPAIEQNKPIYEGVVLSTWKPCVRWMKNGVKKHLESDFMVGDHVALPHWAGIPANGFDPELYRVVREREWGETTDGGIFAKVEFEDKETPDVLYLQKTLDKIDNSLPFHEQMANEISVQLRERFILIDKKKASVTMSGK